MKNQLSRGANSLLFARIKNNGSETFSTQCNEGNWFSYQNVTRIVARIDSLILVEFAALAQAVFLVRNYLNLDYLMFQCVFPFGTAILTFFAIQKCHFGGLCDVIKREMQYFILKSSVIFPHREIVLRSTEWNLMKSCFFQIYVIFWETVVNLLPKSLFSIVHFTNNQK